MKKTILCSLVAWMSISLFGQKVIPLINAHAHNDYEHERPLFEALENGFISVEVDVHLIDGKLWVAHDYPYDLSKLYTLEDLYLHPLLQRIRRNDGEVYPGHEGFFYLMIDVKSEASESYPVLRAVLKDYEEIISVVSGSEDQPGKPVKVFVSGHKGRPFDQILNDSLKYAGIDGRPSELGQDIPASVMPVISQNYKHYLSWDGTGQVDQDELSRLKLMIEKAHAERKKVRLWAAPDHPLVWEFLLSIGVDFINTDRIPEFREFMFGENH